MNKFKAIHILRLGLGVTMLMHCLARIPKLDAFVTKSAAEFDNTILPHSLVIAFLYALPFAEGLTGLLILIGGKASRLGYILGGLTVAALIFGTTLRSDWALAGGQLIYIIAFAFALWLHDYEKASPQPYPKERESYDHTVQVR